MLNKFLTSSILLGIFFDTTSAGLVAQKRADICGAKGYDRGKGNYYYSDSAKLASYAACSQKCTSDSKCKSFGYSNEECLLFNIALSGNFDADSGSSDTYYDRGCITSVSTSSSASASSTAKTTALSTKTTMTASSKSTVSSTTKTTAPGTLPTSTSASKESTSSTKTTAVAIQATTSVSRTSTSSSVSSASVTIPAGCSTPVPVTITSFSWFNSTHNLDCANPNYPSDAQVCWNSTSLCNAGDAGCQCTPYCSTGIPSYAYQPPGFGPADTIGVGLNGGSPYTGANPQSVRRWEIGEGHFDSCCGPDVIGFTGDSNKATRNIGSVYYNAVYAPTCNGMVPRYSASFPLTCSYDAGNNATCTAPVPVQMTFNGYS